MNINQKSRLLSKILRHKPDLIGIKLTIDGWANIDELIQGINKITEFDRDTLEEIVRTDDKKRYVLNSDKTMIRACQGHSIDVQIDFPKGTPPEYLYHGSAEKYAQKIAEEGLKAMTRQYVHLSSNLETAIKVALRRKEIVIYKIYSHKMAIDGYEFFISENGVWLTKSVPVKYLERIDKKDINI